MKASIEAPPQSSQTAFGAATAVVQAEITRTGRPRFPCTWYLEIIDHVQVKDLPHTLHPSVQAIGVATRVIEDQSGVRTAVFILFEGAPGTELACR